MELKLFTGLIDALGKVVDGLKAIVNLPKAERDALCQTLDETSLHFVTLNMVVIRLGDTPDVVADDFLRKAARSDNWNEWMQAEREFRLCRSLCFGVWERPAGNRSRRQGYRGGPMAADVALPEQATTGNTARHSRCHEPRRAAR